MSGVSVRAYCEQHELNRHSFDYWRWKLKEELKPQTKAFVRVVAKKAETETLVVAKLRLGEGLVLECMTWPSVEWLREMRA